VSRSLVALDHNSTIIAVVELSQSSWLVGGVVPDIERQLHKKLEPSPERLLGLLHRWRDEAVRGRPHYHADCAGLRSRPRRLLARWLEARGVEAHVIHPSSAAVSRGHRRAKTDRLDTELLKRGFLGWLRGEGGHSSMARVPTIAEEGIATGLAVVGDLIGEGGRAGARGRWRDAVIIAALALTMVVGVQAFDALAVHGGGQAVLPPDALFDGLAAHPRAPEYWWL
jgi:transposase